MAGSECTQDEFDVCSVNWEEALVEIPATPVCLGSGGKLL